MTPPAAPGVRRFRFRPRYQGVAAVAIGLGGALASLGVVVWGVSASIPLVTGLAGLASGSFYLVSPTWRFAVVVDDAGVAVTAGTATRFRLAWADVVAVIASPSTKTCFVDGGDPARSLLVPGDGAPAPYAIEDRAALYDHIVARVDPARVREVDTLERLAPGARPGA